MLTQNVLGVASFSLLFLLVYPGWEGSAHDATVLKDAIAEGVFTPPPGRYYLADAGYYNAAFLLVPYDGVRYHLKEWMREGVEKPRNKEELFNLRHSSLRNVVERLFGVWKRKFQILTERSEYRIDQEIDLVVALAGLFNFIAQRDRAVDRDWQLSSFTDAAERTDTRIPPPPAESIWAGRDRRKKMDIVRDTIASAMWDDYVAYNATLDAVEDAAAAADVDAG